MLKPISEAVQLVGQALTDRTLISAVLSGPRRPGERAPSRVTIKPVMVRHQYLHQFASQESDKVRHHNHDLPGALQTVKALLETGFKQANLFTSEADVQILVNGKGQARVSRKPPTKAPQPAQHNRTKNHLIPEGQPSALMAQIGVMTAEGEVVAAKYDKFRQINRYLEMVEDVVGALPKGRPIRVVDFGCGKAYLTFALYHYLRVIKGLDAHMVGVDRKEEVIAGNNTSARSLGYDQLSFRAGDIESYVPDAEGVDMVVSLHACDTATDEALAQAVRWGASVILAAPCCQHELYGQIEHPWMAPLTRHGIIRERLASLITDAARAELLEACDYSVQMLEFVAVEHTPKNILIRAVRHAPQDQATRAGEYARFRDFWHIRPRLEVLLSQQGRAPQAPRSAADGEAPEDQAAPVTRCGPA